MKRNFLIISLLFHLNQCSVVLSQNDNKENKESSRKLYQQIQGTQYVPVQQQQPIIYQQAQPITPVYQNIVPRIQTTPVQIQQQPIQIQQVPQQTVQYVPQQTIQNNNRKLITKKYKKKNKSINYLSQLKKMEKDKKFLKVINSNKSYRRKLELIKSEDTSPKHKRKLWGFIKRLFRRIRRHVRRVVRRVKRRIRRVVRRIRPRPKSAAYYKRKYPMPRGQKYYATPGANLNNKPEECSLYLDFLPMFFISILHKSTFRINFSSNCFYTKDIEFQTNFKKTRHLNIDSHPTSVKLFLFENFVELDFQRPELIDDLDIMISKKYRKLQYRHKSEFKNFDLDYQNSVYIKPEVRNSFSRYNFNKIKSKDIIHCRAKTKRIYRPGLPESVFWETLKIPVLPGFKRHRKKGFWVKYMGKFYQVKKSKTMLHPYNTKFYIKAPFYIVSTRMKKGPYYDNYIRLPKGDMMVKYSGKKAFIKYPMKIGGKNKHKVVKLTKFKNAFYYVTKRIFTYPVMLEKTRVLKSERSLVQQRMQRRRNRNNQNTKQNRKLKKKKINKEEQKRLEKEREEERKRRRRVKKEYGTFSDLKKLRNKIGVVKTEIMCYLT